jgi:hypothetical protein
VDLGRLVPLDAREVWKSEPYDFTPWLLNNADALADVLGIDLELSANEHPVGAFSLDLIGRDNTNDCVLIVENQLTATDHGHLGQILTYAAGTEARTVIWMATDFRAEHRQALDWLNMLAGEDARFFGVEIGAVRIGDSVPAPLFKLRAQPNDWAASVAAAAKVSSGSAGNGPLYTAFWTRFLERVHAEHPTWTKAHKPVPANWVSLATVRPGLSYGVSFARGGKLRSELYIDTGDKDANDSIFAHFANHKAEIEATYGRPLTWEDLEGRRACRITDYGVGDVVNGDQTDAYIDWMFDAQERLREALAPFIATVQI